MTASQLPLSSDVGIITRKGGWNDSANSTFVQKVLLGGA